MLPKMAVVAGWSENRVQAIKSKVLNHQLVPK